MSAYARDRARERIHRLAGAGLDLVSFWHEAAEAIAPAVPYYMRPCWYTLDPASLLITSHVQEGMVEFPAEWLALEYYEDDVNKIADVVRSPRGAATLHEATGGDPRRSPHYERIVPYGGDQEMIVGLRTKSGEAWGAVGLYREHGRPMFDSADIDLMVSLAPALAEGAKRALLLGEATDPDGPEAPGLVVVRDDWSVESVTPGVERWLADLPDGNWERGRLPSAVQSVAGRAMRTAEGTDVPGDVAIARVLSRRGQWIVLHGASLVSSASRRVAVIVEPAHPARISPLLMAAYGLTEREQDVTRLVLQGSSTNEIAESLTISAHTVQQHLKNIFEKTAVRSRRDLVGKVFFAHYEPRLRDNERRALAGAPLRGGPIA